MDTCGLSFHFNTMGSTDGRFGMRSIYLGHTTDSPTPEEHQDRSLTSIIMKDKTIVQRDGYCWLSTVSHMNLDKDSK